jgi:uncharacterized protein (TIGR00369 family)
MNPCLTLNELAEFLDGAFPSETRASLGAVVDVQAGHVRMTLDPNPSMVRPGGIVSGPTLMALTDVAAYAVVIAHHGRKEMAVTNGLSISFLRACKMETIIADARLLRLGRRLATVDVRLWQQDENYLVAQSTVSYSLP